METNINTKEDFQKALFDNAQQVFDDYIQMQNDYLQDECYDLLTEIRTLKRQNDYLQDECYDLENKLKKKETTIDYKFAISRKKKTHFDLKYLDIKSEITDMSHRQYFKEIAEKIPYSFNAYSTKFEDILELRDFFSFCKKNNIEIYELSEFEN